MNSTSFLNFPANEKLVKIQKAKVKLEKRETNNLINDKEIEFYEKNLSWAEISLWSRK